MILYKSDQVTLYYSDPILGEISATPMDSRYVQLLDTRSKQQDALTINTAARAGYLERLHSYQTNLDAGRPGGNPPDKPQAKTVSDDGLESFAPFVPPLPDPQAPPAPVTGGLKPVTVPSDRIDVLLKLMMTLNGKLEVLLAK